MENHCKLLIESWPWQINGNNDALSRQRGMDAANYICQGPWNVDLRTPPGPEGSNGSLLDICRGHPGILFSITIGVPFDLQFARVNRKS